MVRRKGLKARLAQISPRDWATFFLAVGAAQQRALVTALNTVNASIATLLAVSER
jgi:hypothetical protein